MTRVLVSVVMLLALGGYAAAQEPARLWRHVADGEITLQRPLPGRLLVSSQRATTLLSSETGKPIWTRNDLVRCKALGRKAKDQRTILPICRVLVDGESRDEYVAFTDGYLILESRRPGAHDSHGEGRRLILVDLRDGKNAFDTKSLGFANMDGRCWVESGEALITWHERDDKVAAAAAFNTVTGKTLWVGELPLVKNILCIALDGTGLVLVQGEADGGKRRVYAVEIASGKALWQSADLARNEWDGYLARSVEGASMAVLHVDEQGPLGIDLRDGSTRWRSDVFRGEKPLGQMRSVDGRIYIAAKTLVAFDGTSGRIVWQLNRTANILTPLETGLLVHSNGLQLLRYETGEPVWSAPRYSAGAPWLMDGPRFFHMSRGSALSVNLENGSQRELGQISFKGGETPSTLELVDGAVVAMSTQNVAGFDPEGKLAYHRYYEPPGLSVMEKFAVSAVSFGMRYAGAAAAMSQARANARDVAFIRGGSGTGIGLYRAYSPALGIRFQSTQNSERVVFMFAEDKASSEASRFNIVAIDKKDGSEAGRLASDSRRPEYSMDTSAARLFVKAGENEIAAYAFSVK